MCASSRPLDGMVRQHDVEKLAEKRFPPFDEFCVDAEYIDLPRVQAGSWMVCEPGEDVENLCPFRGLRQQHQRLARDPSAQERKTSERSLCQLRKAVRVRLPPDNGKRVIERRQDEIGRQSVATQGARVDVLPPD